MVVINQPSDIGAQPLELLPLPIEEAAWRAATRWYEGQRLETYLRQSPAMSWLSPSGSFVVGAHWRRRPDIAVIIELSSGAHRRALLQQFLGEARARGCQLVTPSFDESERAASFYRENGFRVLDEIVHLERVGIKALPTAPAIRWRLVDPTSATDYARLLEIDHAAFPWLWRNSSAELRWYVELRSSTVLLAFDGGLPVGYAAYTVYHEEANLDRLAVHGSVAGRGHGTALLRTVLAQLAELGVRQVTLTTQADNTRALELYKRFGFRRTNLRYRLFGRWLGDAKT